MKIGIFGGAFDPPHLGHLKIAKAAQEQFGLDQVLWIPTGQPPHKGEPGGSGEERRSMAELLIEGENGFLVSAMELERKGKSYTIDTLSALKTQNPFDKLFLILGSDQLELFPQWKEAKAILMLATPLIAPRPGHELKGIEKKLKGLPESGIQKIMKGFIRMEAVDLSSSDVREDVKAGEDVSALVGPKIAAYILRNKLYRKVR